jgi:hypothetical protein
VNDDASGAYGHVVSDPCGEIDHVVRTDIAVGSYNQSGPGDCLRANIGDQLVPDLFRLEVPLRFQFVHPGVSDGDMHIIFIRRIKGRDLIERYKRSVEKNFRTAVIPIYGEHGYLIERIVSEFVKCEFRHSPIAEQYYLFFWCDLLLVFRGFSNYNSSQVILWIGVLSTTSRDPELALQGAFF